MYSIAYDDGDHEENVPAVLVMTPAEMRARLADWRRVDAWVEHDGARPPESTALQRAQQHITMDTATKPAPRALRAINCA